MQCFSKSGQAIPVSPSSLDTDSELREDKLKLWKLNREIEEEEKDLELEQRAAMIRKKKRESKERERAIRYKEGDDNALWDDDDKSQDLLGFEEPSRATPIAAPPIRPHDLPLPGVPGPRTPPAVWYDVSTPPRPPAPVGRDCRALLQNYHPAQGPLNGWSTF